MEKTVDARKLAWLRAFCQSGRRDWDGDGAVIDPYTEMLELTGPCAGIVMVFGPYATWGEDWPPRPDRVEDAHAKQYDRPHPQFDADRLAATILGALGN